MKKFLPFALLTALLGISNTAFAGDTVELLDKGVIELVPTVSLDNLQSGVEPGFSTSFTAGYGVTDFMTINSTIYFGADQGLAGTSFGATIQSVFTPVDTEHFDLDVTIDLDFDIASGFVFNPGLEFNYDTQDDMSGFGAYMRMAFPVTSQYEFEGSDNIISDVNFDLTLGLYYSFVEDQAAFLEGGFTVENLASNFGASDVFGGWISLGYNATLMENFELLTEIVFNLDQSEDGDGVDCSSGIMLGAVFDIYTQAELPEVEEIEESQDLAPESQDSAPNAEESTYEPQPVEAQSVETQTVAPEAQTVAPEAQTVAPEAQTKLSPVKWTRQNAPKLVVDAINI